MDALLIVHVGAAVLDDFARAAYDFFLVGLQAFDHVILKIRDAFFGLYFRHDEQVDCLGELLQKFRIILQELEDIFGGNGELGAGQGFGHDFRR